MENSVADIRQYKNELRNKFKTIRKSMPENLKKKNDNKIYNKLISTSMFKNSDTVLIFVSTEIEVDTKNIIQYVLSIGKKVAVPKCISGTRLMDFYLITSLDDLEVATFSVLEPITDKCEKLTEFNNSICIIPGLGFDLEGYRLGYGKGYYDRFLSGYNGLNIGICYCSCTVNSLRHGRYDKKVNYLITEKYIKTIK